MDKIKISAKKGSVKTIKTDMLVAGVFEGGFTPEAKELDKILKSGISKMIKSKEFKPEFKETKLFRSDGKIKNILVVGLGKKKEFDTDRLRKVSASTAKEVRGERIKNFVTTLHNTEVKATGQGKAQAVAEGIILGLYKFEKYKKPEKDDVKINSVDLLCDSGINEIKEGIRIGTVISDAVNYARDITNEPSSSMTPANLAEEARKLAKKDKLKIKVFGKREIKKMGMGGLLGVNRGSNEEPKFIVLEYKGGGKKKIAVVGKGITFDSGGLDIKSADSMSGMQGDKGGAAVVLGIMQASAKLRVPVNVIGVIPATENMPGSSALKPGDIIRAYNRKTIEIVNTDAEGRLILADALSYVEKNYKPDAIIDFATLTGSCIIALGYYVAGILGTDEKLIKKIYDAGQKTGEKVWHLPLWEEYKDYPKSDVADVKNAGKSSIGPGTINAAVFLGNFVEKTKWVHIDIAGTSWPEEEKEYVPKNGSGFGVRLVTQLLLEWK